MSQATQAKAEFDEADRLRQEQERLNREASMADPVADKAFMAMLQRATPRLTSAVTWEEIESRFSQEGETLRKWASVPLHHRCDVLLPNSGHAASERRNVRRVQVPSRRCLKAVGGCCCGRS